MSRRVLVAEIRPGDVVRFPSDLIHEDVAGRMVEQRVISLEYTEDGRTFFHWGDGSKTWWNNLETVEVVNV